MKYATKFLLAGDKFKSEIHLRQPEFTDSGCGPFTKTKKEYQNSKQQEIHDIFIKTNYKDLAFSMTCLWKF